MGLTGFVDPELWRLGFVAAIFYTQTNVDEQAETVHMPTTNSSAASSSTRPPQLMPEGEPVTHRQKKRRPTSIRVAYDPQLANHCWYQCTLRALHLPHGEGAVMALREMLAQRWQRTHSYSAL